jgi:peroxiredoxin family protein
MSEELEAPELRSLSVIATRGASNSIFQIATLVRAASALGARVDVLFQDAALAKLQRDRIDVNEWSPLYETVAGELQERLRAADFSDMESFLRDAKEHGDDVHFWASTETLASSVYSLADLTGLLDGERSSSELERQPTDALLRF